MEKVSQDLEAKASFCNDYSSDPNCWELSGTWIFHGNKVAYVGIEQQGTPCFSVATALHKSRRMELAGVSAVRVGDQEMPAEECALRWGLSSFKTYLITLIPFVQNYENNGS